MMIRLLAADGVTNAQTARTVGFERLASTMTVKRHADRQASSWRRSSHSYNRRLLRRAEPRTARMCAILIGLASSGQKGESVMQVDFTGHGLAFSETRQPIRFYPAAGGAKITLRLNVRRASTDPNRQTFRIAGWLSAGSRHNRVAVCPLTVEHVINPSHVDTQIEMTGFVSHDQLRVLEELRGGSDMEISLDFEVVCLAEDSPHFDARRAQEVFWLSPGEWSEAVARIDAASFVELLIPITADKALNSAALRLRDARGDIRDGQYEEAIKKDRAALEPVKAAHCPSALLRSAREKSDSRQRDQAERWAVLIDDLFSLLSGAVHDDAGVTENFGWSRSDAVALTAAVGGLVRRLADERTHSPI